ncbi:GNAT family N-acetyltransferase [candidate division KSB1 bacterium]|nr:GNAT family N-acetyltransferase [candidate division KSB1 bacterium]
MIRVMQAADKSIVMAILHNTNFFSNAEIDMAEELVDIYLNDPEQKDYKFVVIENPERLVAGFMTYGPTPLTKDVFDLYWIAVSPSEQNHGYGRKMVQWLENQMEDKKGRLLIIETSSQERYEKTRRFYISQGYKESVRIKDFYKPDDDRIIYVKYFR